MCAFTVKIYGVRDNPEALEPTVGAVLGCQHIGTGLSQFNELISMVGIEHMSYNSWQNAHSKAAIYVKKASEKEMAKAAAEERSLAIERGDVVHGIPCTMVEADGSYIKRTYMFGKYDSSACCVVIIGRYTQKVLQIIVKQKTCSICDYASSRRIPIKKHTCYRNHGKNLSSTSMETAAITEAFANNVENHNLIYKVLISDGDSSNYKAILDSNPYGPYGVEVTNILCTNHIMRNVSTSIKVLSKKKGRIGKLRKKIEDSAPRFIEAIGQCVDAKSAEDISWEFKCKTLRDNINKLPYHIFGDHSKCAENKYRCRGLQIENKENVVPALQEANLMDDVEQCVFRAFNNASNLLHKVTTNRSESFNALIAKAIGAKRLHLCKKDSYATRCHIAVISQNNGETIQLICKTAEKQALSTAEYVQQKRKKFNSLRKLRMSNRDPVQEIIKKAYRKADKDYGLNAEQPDVDKNEFTSRKKEHYLILNRWRLDREAIEVRTRNQNDYNK